MIAIEQREHAEESLQRTIDRRASLATAAFAGTRRLEIGGKAVTMFAIGVKVEAQTRDIAFARTPELAKLLGMLIQEIVAAEAPEIEGEPV